MKKGGIILFEEVKDREKRKILLTRKFKSAN